MNYTRYQALPGNAAPEPLVPLKNLEAEPQEMRSPVEYRFRLHHNNKIESTVNTQPLSFSTPPSTVNSQQLTVNNYSGATGIDRTWERETNKKAP
ncbi:hypothetical protein [Microcoleus sp. herbarium2]|uniref:hypothetical protein n=1 Tax=Microcoleus sp. herbarium2 TaxID=3055433 RepID=UPI002FD17B06